MSVVKMQAVTIAGKIDEFENIVDKYVYNRDIDLEDTVSVLSDKHKLQPFEEAESYGSVAADILRLAGIQPEIRPVTDNKVTLSEMTEFLDKISEKLEEEKKLDDDLSEKIRLNEEKIQKLGELKGFDADISRLDKMEFFGFRYGRLPKGGYKTLNDYLERLEVVFVKVSEDPVDIWGYYIAPASKLQKIDEIFSSLYFVRTEIPEGLQGSAKQMIEFLEKENEKIRAEMKKNSDSTKELLEGSVDRLTLYYNIAQRRLKFAEVRRHAAHSKDFFYIVGWMSKKEAKALEKEISKDQGVVMFYSEDPEKLEDFIIPPTKLKNNFVFKPFEMFVKMYGLPNYREIDPTPILAITYILFFGMMFGDVGQSAVLAIGGFILYKVKKIDLAGVIGWVGVSGIIFGFIYGSFFGNEEILGEWIPWLNPIQIKPMDQIATLLIGAIAMGVVIIAFGMVVNIINSIKQGKYGEAVFGHNGCAGLAFYVSLMIIAVSKLPAMFGAGSFLNVPTMPFVIIMLISIVVMYISEPLSKLVDGEKDWLPKEGMFFVENLFEMFEVLLSFFTNTISFLRVGAFAIVHVGMMMVVQVLSGSGGVGGIIVQIFGNILVMGLEGLIVGIQVLRLEYYEMFSRYFSGTGRPFISLKDNK